MANRKKEDNFKNKVALVGSITFKKFRRTAKAQHVLNLSVNTKNHRNNFTKINCVLWDKDAEALNTQIETIRPEIDDNERIDDGVLVKLVGELQQSEYEDKNGINRVVTSILVTQYKLLEG